MQQPSTNATGTQLRFYYVQYGSTLQGDWAESVFTACTYRGWRNDGVVFIHSNQVGDSCDNAKVVEAKRVKGIEFDIYDRVTVVEVVPFKTVREHQLLYYAEDVGIIRKYVYEDSITVGTWELLRYEVEPF